MAMWYIYGEYKLNMNVRPHGIKNEQVLGKESILCGKHIVNVRQVIYFAPCTKKQHKTFKSWHRFFDPLNISLVKSTMYILQFVIWRRYTFSRLYGRKISTPANVPTHDYLTC